MAADEKDEAVPEEGQKKKKSPIILIAVLVVLGVVLSAGVAFFITTKLMADTAVEGGSKHHDPGIFVKMGDPKEGILVNVGGAKAGKFLKTSIVLEMNPGKKDNIEEGRLLTVAETKALDTIMQILRSSKMEEFDADKQEDLKKKIKDQLNEELGEGSVYDVYITSFLLQ